jgi:hypothetical protein
MERRRRRMSFRSRNILTVEHDVIPLDGADVFEQSREVSTALATGSHWLRT